MIKRIATSIFAIVSINVYADSAHDIGVGVVYHLDQESSSGYQVNYHWLFSPAFEFKASYYDVGSLSLKHEQADQYIDLTRANIGMTFLKPFSEKASIYAGSGVSFITNSSHQQLVDKGAAPYLDLGVRYQLTENLRLDFGQASYFDGDNLGTNHSVFLNIKWRFYSDRTVSRPATESKQLHRPAKVAVVAEAKTPLLNKQAPVDKGTNPEITKVTPIVEPLPIVTKVYIQFGVFTKIENATAMKAALTKQLKNNEVYIKESGNRYKVMSRGFEKEEDARQHLAMLKSIHEIDAFIVNQTSK